MELEHNRPTRRTRVLAGALLLTVMAAGAGALLTRNKASKPASDAEPSAANPPLIPLGDRRFRGPDALTVQVPENWRMDPGSSKSLWGTLRPRDSLTRLPQIGVGSISTNGLEPPDAIATVEEILNEILPELSSESSDAGGYRITTGSGQLAGTDVMQVRMMRVLNDRVVVAWGLFESPTEGAGDLVHEVIESVDVA